jgi:hypothetical protein
MESDASMGPDLRHSPTGLVRSVDGLCMRSYDKAQEEEAFGVGAATLIPWNALFPRSIREKPSSSWQRDMNSATS